MAPSEYRVWASETSRSNASRPRSPARSTGTPIFTRACRPRLPDCSSQKMQAPRRHVAMTDLPSPPLVDAIITCHNHGRFLGAAIDSVLEQSYPNLAIVVVDDGSTDETAAVAARYRERGVRYLRQP